MSKIYVPAECPQTSGVPEGNPFPDGYTPVGTEILGTHYNNGCGGELLFNPPSVKTEREEATV